MLGVESLYSWLRYDYLAICHFYWTWLIDWPPACTARNLGNSLLGDRHDGRHRILRPRIGRNRELSGDCCSCSRDHWFELPIRPPDRSWLLPASCSARAWEPSWKSRMESSDCVNINDCGRNNNFREREQQLPLNSRFLPIWGRRIRCRPSRRSPRRLFPRFLAVHAGCQSINQVQ